MPNNGDIQFRIPGRRSAVAPKEKLSGIATVEVKESFQIRPPTRGKEDLILREFAPETLIELEFESGAKRYTRADQLAQDLAAASGPTRGGSPQSPNGAVIIPASWGGTTRGDSELLAALRVLHVSPMDPVVVEIAKSGAKYGAQKIAAYFEKHLNAGLFEITDPREPGHEIIEPIQTAPAKPILLLLHGTASSTAGSFSGLAGKSEWEQFRKDYASILTLEHRTFSASPIQNALDAARLLPHGATLHLLSHSRGGLIGELLCLNDIRSNQIEDLNRRQPEQVEDLKTLAAVLRDKQLKVQRFVRVACPSRGTLLASDRLDLYFSLLLKVLEYVPVLHENVAYAVFKATFLKLIEMKASAGDLPGIEAMRPESPFIALLNRPDLSTQADLAIVAGRTDGFTLSLRSLVKLASDAFYRQANDFVVNTEAMYWGMQRQSGAFYFSDRGTDVFHFNYFKNDRSRKQVGAWLSCADKRPPNLFVDLSLRLRKDLMFPEWRGEDKRPVLIYVPPFLGTYLKGERGRLWLEVPGLLPGDLDGLADLQRLSIDGVVPYRSRRLLEFLNGSFSIKPFAYDWRKPLDESVKTLAGFIRKQLEEIRDSGRPLAILAFSSGGIVLSRLSSLDRQLWIDLKSRGTRMVALGNPTEASRQAKSLIDGSGELPHLLSFVDGRRPSDLAALFAQLPGIADLASATSAAVEELRYVLGRSPEGESKFAGAIVWHSSVRHGNLADNPPIFEAIRDVLTTGTTSRLQTEEYALPPAGVPVPVLYPSEPELFDAAFGADRDPVTEPPITINAFVRHAHLREALHPVIVGHYLDDVIVSAEKVLDEQLGGRLSNRFHMDLYPGRDGTSAVIEAPGCRPPGALVIGLGEVGMITAEKVRTGVAAAAIGQALAELEATDHPVEDPISVGITSLLIGTYGGNALSVRNSVAAIIDGIVDANRTLRSSDLRDRVRIDEVEIIELYEDLAVQAARELVQLEERLREYADDRVILNTERYMRTGAAGQFHRPGDPYLTGWWRRIAIEQKAGQLHFVSLTERARAEAREESRQLKLVNDFVRQAIATTSYDEDLSAMLFEVLLPNDLKDEMRDEASVVFVLDQDTASYPWELLAQRTQKTIKPLATCFGLMRQFATPHFRISPRSSRQTSAFVVGDPENEQERLPKAREEADRVTGILRSNGYEVKVLKQSDASARSVITQLFAREYRILHLAGHGRYNPDAPLSSGLILSGGHFLTSAEIRQLRVIPELVFLNCCYLGKDDEISQRRQLMKARPNDLAATLARELINMGVKAVIAAGWAVEDDAALTFATTFYKEMIEHGEKFGQALLKARQETARQYPGSNTWGAYQCYGNPDFTLSQASDGYGAQSTGARTYVARQECLDRLRSIHAEAHGATDASSIKLADELARIESSIPHNWLDGEVLTAIGAAYGELGRFDQAIEAYRRAMADPKARQPFAAVEQLVNLLDRSAARLDMDSRKPLLDEAVRLLDAITQLGASPERSALSGGLYKRVADAGPGLDPATLGKALKSYEDATRRYREIHGRPYPYAILNSIALKMVANDSVDRELEKQNARESLEESKRLAEETRDIWDRVGEPDAMLILFLLDGTLPNHEDEIVAKYREVMNAASRKEKDSIGKQLTFLKRRLSGNNHYPTEALQSVVERLGL